MLEHQAHVVQRGMTDVDGIGGSTTGLEGMTAVEMRRKMGRQGDQAGDEEAELRRRRERERERRQESFSGRA